MAVPSSGPLKLWDSIWNQEIGDAKGNNSLHGAAIYAGFSTPDAMSDFYGWSDVIAPSVSTQAMSSIGQTNMVANGNVSSTGGENPTRGFYFGTSTNAYSNTKTSIGVGGTGGFSRNFTGLPSNTTHYGWAFACNSAGEAVGGRVQAATQPPPFTPVSFDLSQSYICNQVNNPSGQSQKTSQAYTGYRNPYTGASNTIAAGSQNINTYNMTYTLNCRTAVQNSMNYHFGGNTGGAEGLGSGYVKQRVANNQNCFQSVSFSPAQPNATNQGCYVYGSWFGMGNSGATQFFCLNSDIRLKTNINYL